MKGLHEKIQSFTVIAEERPFPVILCGWWYHVAMGMGFCCSWTSWWCFKIFIRVYRHFVVNNLVHHTLSLASFLLHVLVVKLFHFSLSIIPPTLDLFLYLPVTYILPIFFALSQFGLFLEKFKKDIIVPYLGSQYPSQIYNPNTTCPYRWKSGSVWRFPD